MSLSLTTPSFLWLGALRRPQASAEMESPHRSPSCRDVPETPPCKGVLEASSPDATHSVSGDTGQNSRKTHFSW